MSRREAVVRRGYERVLWPALVRTVRGEKVERPGPGLMMHSEGRPRKASPNHRLMGWALGIEWLKRWGKGRDDERLLAQLRQGAVASAREQLAHGLWSWSTQFEPLSGMAAAVELARALREHSDPLGIAGPPLVPPVLALTTWVVRTERRMVATATPNLPLVRPCLFVDVDWTKDGPTERVVWRRYPVEVDLWPAPAPMHLCGWGATHRGVWEGSTHARARSCPQFEIARRV